MEKTIMDASLAWVVLPELTLSRDSGGKDTICRTIRKDENGRVSEVGCPSGTGIVAKF